MSSSAAAPTGPPPRPTPAKPAVHRGGLTERLIHKFVAGLTRRLAAAGRSQRAAGRLAILLIFVALGELDACAFWAPEVTPFLFGAAVVWWLSVERPGPMAKTGRDLALALLTGITLLCVALLALNCFEHSIAPGGVRSTELTLTRVRMTIDGWMNPSLEWMLIAGTALVAAILIAAKFSPVSRLRRAKAPFDFMQTVLLVVTSFVIYAQSPLQSAVKHTHTRMATEYRAALDREWKADARTAAARALTQQVQSLSVTQRHQLGVRLDAISKGARTYREDVRTATANAFATIDNGQASGDDLATVIANALAVTPPEVPAYGLPSTGLPTTGLPTTGLPTTGLTDIGAPADGLRTNDPAASGVTPAIPQAVADTWPTLEESTVIDPLPATNHALDGQSAAIAEREASAVRAELRASEAVRAATELISHLVSSAPAPEALKAVIAGLIENLGDAHESKIKSLFFQKQLQDGSGDGFADNVKLTARDLATAATPTAVARDALSYSPSYFVTAAKPVPAANASDGGSPRDSSRDPEDPAPHPDPPDPIHIDFAP